MAWVQHVLYAWPNMIWQIAQVKWRDKSKRGRSNFLLFIHLIFLWMFLWVTRGKGRKRKGRESGEHEGVRINRLWFVPIDSNFDRNDYQWIRMGWPVRPVVVRIYRDSKKNGNLLLLCGDGIVQLFLTIVGGCKPGELFKNGIEGCLGIKTSIMANWNDRVIPGLGIK